MNYISFLLVPTGLLVSCVGIFTSYRAQVHSTAGSTMVTLLMSCSYLAAVSATGKVYMQMAGLWGSGIKLETYILYVAPHDLARSIFSSANVMVMLYKVMVRMSKGYLDPKQGMLACFALLAATKIIVIVIIPELESNESDVGELKSLFIASVIECVETISEVICLACLAVYSLCCRGEDETNEQEPPPANNPPDTQELPPIILLLFSRISIFIHLVSRFVTSIEKPVYVPMNSFIFLHTMVFPVLLGICVPCLKSAFKRLVSADQQPLLDLEMEDVCTPDLAQENAPTRPSSVALPQLLPGIPEIKRISYQSNIRYNTNISSLNP